MAKSKTKTKTDTKKTKAKTAKNNANTAEKVEMKASAIGTTAAEFVSKNAVPLGMVAAGIGILAARNLNGGDNAVTKAATRGRKRLAAMTETGRGKARKSATKLRKKAEKGAVRSKETVATHPVAAGVAAAAVGAGLAVAVPKLMNRDRS
ncbi:hypothetical protein EOI86_15380 [Hwanghaeella grinnelliae]|uniref:Transmembrane protein n=1 Tax=Hwanghaeella grinnelliae TaxID=2500179 RepID=A0A437QPX3_9PROT|nr:hypothetical protein [Hwanghaeella grinnelliae]RVU36568.1 hypothetical protein EOI86_15380 [Hwanghaeella grinnelliae]